MEPRHESTASASTQQKLSTIVADMAAELQPAVASIESSLATTKDHYGDYMHALSRLSNGSAFQAQVAALALIQAGANRNGVLSALRAMGYA